MATVSKDFRIKAGLVVEGTTGTINGETIATQTWVGLQGYLTTETDPVFVASAAYGIDSTDISNWDTAYGWGDHGAAGYLTTETDPVFTASEAYSITSTDTSNWDTAYGWGDHGAAGYLTTETDPVFTASEAYGITSTDTSNWDTAYGWGNHASAGYLTVAVTSLAGTTNEIAVDVSTGAVTIGLPDDVTIGNDLTVTGNLTVNGTTTTLNTETLAVEDNIVLLNKNVTGTPTVNAGIEVERGTYTNASIYWNETANKWYISTPDDSNGAAVEAEIATGGSLNIFSTVSDGSTTATADSSTDTLTFAAGTGLSVAVNASTDTVTYSLNASADAAVGSVVLPDAKLGSATATASGTSVDIDSFATASYSSAKYVVQAKNPGGDIEVTEILIAVDGSNNVYITEYANFYSNASLAEFTAAYATGTVTLSATSTVSGVVFKVSKTLIEA